LAKEPCNAKKEAVLDRFKKKEKEEVVKANGIFLKKGRKVYRSQTGGEGLRKSKWAWTRAAEPRKPHGFGETRGENSNSRKGRTKAIPRHRISGVREYTGIGGGKKKRSTRGAQETKKIDRPQWKEWGGRGRTDHD